MPQAKAVSSYFLIPGDAFADAIINEAKTIDQKVESSVTKAIQDQLINRNDENAVNLFKIEEKQRQLAISNQKIPGWLATLESSVKAVN